MVLAWPSESGERRPRPTSVSRCVCTLLARPSWAWCDSTPVQGFRLGWDIESFNTALRLGSQKGKAGRWAHHGWHRWARHVTTNLMIPGSHMQKRVPSADSSSIGTMLADSQNGAEFRMVSTHALVGLSVRWAHHSKNSLRTEKDRQAVLSFVQGALHQSAGNGFGDCTWTLFLDVEPMWTPPLRPQGHCPILLEMQQWVINFSPLQQSRSGFAVALLQCVAPVCDEALRAHAKAVLFTLNGKDDVLLKAINAQLIWFIGRRLDEFFSTSMDSSNTAIADMSVRRGEKAVAKYFLASRRVFADPQHLHISLDASNIARKSITVGVIALPTNIGAVYPPQVLQEHNFSHPRTNLKFVIKTCWVCNTNFFPVLQTLGAPFCSCF